jgi:hypothetical protein
MSRCCFTRDSAIQKCFRRFCLQVRRFLVPCQLSGRSCHPVRTPIYPLFHPSGRRAIPSGRPDRQSIIRPDYVYFRPDPSLYREASGPACIRPDDSAARPDALQYSIKLPILSKIKYGKIAATVRTRSYIRQESQFKFNRLDVCQYGLDARSTDMEIPDSTSTVRTVNLGHPDARSLIWKLLAADVRSSGRHCLTVRMRLLNRKDF